MDALKEREEGILRHVVFSYIQTAVPVGSRFISKHFERQLSPATIRNVMADLEELGFLAHPHTSAGRVPTDMGYRYYVDYLMDIQQLSETDKRNIEEVIEKASDTEEMLRETSKLISKISRQLSLVSSPQLSSGIFDKIELIPVSATRLLVIISIRTGLVKTVMLEVQSEYRRETLDQISIIMNERLAGLTLQQIRDTFCDRLRDVQDEKTGLIRLFIESVDQIFIETHDRERLHISGTQNIIVQPEFIDPKNFRSVIELIENEEMIVHLLEKHQEKNKEYFVTIGSEHNTEQAKDYSIVSATYESEGVSGTVGVIGPKRMEYPKLIPLVEYVAHALAKILKG